MSEAPPGLLRPALPQIPFWFLQQLDPSSSAYNIAFALRLEGTLRQEVLQDALSRVVDRQMILRQRFVEIDGQPWLARCVHAPTLGTRRANDTGDAMRIAQQEAEIPFRLDEGPLFRAVLVSVADDDTRSDGLELNYLVIIVHHAIFDGWSLKVFLGDLGVAYADALDGQTPPRPPLEHQYTDWARSTYDWLESSAYQRELDFWRTQMAGVPGPADLPQTTASSADDAGAAKDTRASPGASFTHWIPDATWRPLVTFAQKSGTTPFMVLLAGLSTFLHRYTGETDLVIGTPSAARLKPRVRPLIGLFINTLPIRIEVDPRVDVATLLDETRVRALGAYRHQRLPFDRLVHALHPARAPGANPLFNTMLTLHNEVQMPNFPGLRVSYVDIPTRFAKLQLTVAARPRPQGLRLDFEYATDLWTASTAARAADHLERILASFAADPHRRLMDIKLVSPAEERVQHAHLVGPIVDVPATAIVDLVRATAEQRPEHVAVLGSTQRLSYAELVEQVEHVAAHLCRQGVSSGDRVGLCVERSEKLVVAILGLWRAGAAYVPIEPDHPPARIQAMLDDAQVRQVLVEGVDGLPLPADKQRLDWPTDRRTPLTTGSWPRIEEESDAYVLFTSGSTGRPKGVVVSHRAVREFVHGMRVWPGIGAADRLLALTTVAFDISIAELLLPLVAGSTVIVADAEARRDPHRLAEAIERHEPTVVQATPTTFRLLVEHGWPGRPGLRLWSGGEALSRDLATELLSRGARLWNLYGPTETTVYATGERVEIDRLPASNASIGRPMTNVTLHIADEQGAMVPWGVRGELWIGGPRLAEGYASATDLTSARFVERDGRRFYKTGDRVHLGPDGRLEFHGRIDHQIKLRGLRIEPGEIESVLRADESVADAVVTLSPGPAGPQLIAHVVASGPAMVDHWRRLTRSRLPPYMQPTHFVVLAALPVTASGKIDRRRLPAPNEVLPRRPTGVLPSDPVEVKLSQMWADLLLVRYIDSNANFFDLGGHSLLVVQLASRIEATFGHRISVADLFQAQTLREQGELLRGEGAAVVWRTLYPAQTNGQGPPLFLLGAVTRARALAPLLPADQPVYGLHLFGLMSDFMDRELTIPQIAAQYLEEVRLVQPHGPYLLAGYCQDAKIALEMALQLQWAGESVAFLGFIDMVWRHGTRRKGGVRFQRNLRRFGPRFLAHWARRRLQDGWISQRAWVSEPYHAAVSRVRNRALPVEVRNRRLVEAVQHALHTYVPRPYPGDLDVFLSGEYFSPSASTTLRGMADGTLLIHEVPGLHDTLFASPQLECLAKKIATRLPAGIGEPTLIDGGRST